MSRKMHNKESGYTQASTDRSPSNAITSWEALPTNFLMLWLQRELKASRCHWFVAPLPCEAAVLFAKGFAKGAAVRSGPTCFACHVTLLDMCSHPCTCGHAVSHTFDVSQKLKSIDCKFDSVLVRTNQKRSQIWSRAFFLSLYFNPFGFHLHIFLAFSQWSRCFKVIVANVACHIFFLQISWAKVGGGVKQRSDSPSYNQREHECMSATDMLQFEASVHRPKSTACSCFAGRLQSWRTWHWFSR